MRKQTGVVFFLIFSCVSFFATAGPSAASPKETELLTALNALRQEPRTFLAELKALLPRFSGKELRLTPEMTLITREGVAAVEDAIQYVEKAMPVGPLKISSALGQAARSLVEDESKSGTVGHTGTDGATPHERITRFGTPEYLWGENVSYGDFDSATGRSVVLGWLIDDGVPTRGHRKNMRHSVFQEAGVACGAHPKYGTMCVVDLADRMEVKSK